MQQNRGFQTISQPALMKLDYSGLRVKGTQKQRVQKRSWSSDLVKQRNKRMRRKTLQENLEQRTETILKTGGCPYSTTPNPLSHSHDRKLKQQQQNQFEKNLGCAKYTRGEYTQLEKGFRKYLLVCRKEVPAPTISTFISRAKEEGGQPTVPRKTLRCWQH